MTPAEQAVLDAALAWEADVRSLDAFPPGEYEQETPQETALRRAVEAYRRELS